MKIARKYGGFLFCAAALLMLPEVEGRTGTNDAKPVATSVKRDPFWPVGYLPEKLREPQLTNAQRALRSVGGNEDWKAAMKLVDINGVSSRAGSEFFAIINGKIRRVGERVSVSHGGMSYTWVIDGIKPPGSVKLRRVSVK